MHALRGWRLRRPGSIVGFLALALLAGFTSGLRAHADGDVAAFLLEQAKKAIAVRKYDEAVTKLERARTEDPELFEASYLLGQVLEKRKEPAKALAAFRVFRDACTAPGATLDKKTARLLKRARKRIAILGKGEVALEKLQAAFSDAVVRFARRMQVRDTDIAIDGLRRVLSVLPGDEDARALLATLTGSEDPAAPHGDTDPKAAPIAGIKVWRDLLAKRGIPPGQTTSYKRKVLTIDSEGGTIYWTDPTTDAPGTYVYEMEFRFLKEYANGYLLGLAFGDDEAVARNGSTECVMAFAEKTLVTLIHASGGQNIDVGRAVRKPTPMGTWMRLTVAVQGRKVRVFLDGEQVLHRSVPGRKTLNGRIGVFHQRCAAEVRTLRLGTKR